MASIIDIVLPAFCLIGLGYLTARTGYLTEATGDGLAAFVFKIAVPVLLVRSIAAAEYGDVNPWAFVAVYGLGVLLTWLLAAGMITILFKRGYRASVIAGISACYSNLILLGVPLIERAYGHDGLQILFFLVSMHLPIMMTVTTFLMEYAVRADGVETKPFSVKNITTTLLRNFAVNPIIIGILVGVAWHFSGFGVGGLVGEVMDLLARTTGPLALFALGMGLIKYGIKGNLMPAFGLAALNLLIMPAIVYGVGTTIIVLPILWLKIALLCAACPTGVNAYLFATYFEVAEGLATNAIVLSLLGSLLTIPFWLSVV